MKVFRKIIILLLITVFLVGCYQGEQVIREDEQYKSVTITDASGKDITITQPIERVAILDHGTAEILRALGVIDLIVGNHQALDDNPFYPELQGVPVVATHSEINFEKLAEVEPQVVFSSVRAHGVVTENEHVENFNIIDIKLNLRNPEVIKDEVILLGKLFGKEEKAQELVDFYNKYEKIIESIIADVAPEDRATVFVEHHGGDFKTGAPGSRFYEQTILAGAINIAEGLSGEPQVSDEWVAEINPDVFLREASGFGYHVTSNNNAKIIHQEIINRPALENTKAVQNNSVYLIGVDIYSRPGYIVGVSYLASWLYPDLFADFDPEVVHKEYLELFHPGMEYKGIYVYNQ